MTGPQLLKWRLDHDLTLREVAEKHLGGEVTHTAVSRWERDNKPIPSWAAEKLLATTQITLPLSELHTLLDAARADDVPAQQLIGTAIREWLARRKNSAPTPPAPEIIRLNEMPTPYRIGGSHGDHDPITHDARPMRKAAQEHHEP